ncbi:putative transcription factor WD40-like family [Helianthus debilis subsp. tardiflorus]
MDIHGRWLICSTIRLLQMDIFSLVLAKIPLLCLGMEKLETGSESLRGIKVQLSRYACSACCISVCGSSVKFWDANHSGLVKSYDMSCNVESASLEPKLGDKFITGGEDMWIRLFDFNTGEEIGLPGVLLIPSFAQTLVYFEFYRL